MRLYMDLVDGGRQEEVTRLLSLLVPSREGGGPGDLHLEELVEGPESPPREARTLMMRRERPRSHPHSQEAFIVRNFQRGGGVA